MTKELEISAMPTPNPNTIKFLVNVELLEKGSIEFNSPEDAKGSLIAEKLFEVTGLTQVFVGKNFISITKAQEAGWEDVLESSSNEIKAILQETTDVISKEIVDRLLEEVDESDEIAGKIKRILDDEIRPAIAMDGGDCQFISFEEGIVTLQLQGACSTCPSATMTLKMGIEGRLKEEIPEVLEVVQY
jgi:Fe-S cluster biogenesis protein NfuA